MASAKDLSGNPPSGGDGSGVWALLPRDGGGALTPASYSGGYRPRPEILTSKPTAAAMLHAMRRRMGLAVGLGLLTAIIIAALVWVFVPVRYEAAAVVRVAASTPSIMGTQPSIDFENYKRSQAVAIKLPKVLYKALQQDEISNLSLIKRQSDPAAWLADKLLLDFPQNGEYLRVALRGDEPKDLAPVVNAIVQAYMTEVVDSERAQIRERRDNLEKKVQEYQDSIRKSKERLANLADSQGTSDSETAKNAYLKERLAYESLNGRVNDLRNRVFSIDQEIQIATVQAKNVRSLPDELIDAEISKDPRIIQLETDIAKRQNDLSALKTVTRRPDRDPDVQALTASIGAMQAQVEDRKQELRTTIMQGSQYQKEDPKQKIAMLQAQRDSLSKMLDTTTTDANNKYNELSKLFVYSSDLETQKSANKVTEEIAAKLQGEYEMAKIDAQTPPRITIYDNAEAPKDNDAFRKYLIMSFGALLGFTLVVLGVSRMEFQSRRVNTSAEISEGLGLRLMGELPSLNGRRMFSLRSTPPAVLQGMVAESIDSIRMALIHDAAVEGTRVVMVTSASEHEGKTTVACNLAASLARSGRRTLLVDGNLRNPCVHQMFDLPLEPGLCEVLRNEIDVDGVTVPTRVEGLFVLPAGYCDGVSLQALAKNAPREIFERLRTQYEFIVIDGSPVLTVADALSFGHYTDSAILSVRRDVSQIPKVYEATERLKSVGVNVTGAVINGVQDRPSRSMYALALPQAGAHS